MSLLFENVFLNNKYKQIPSDAKYLVKFKLIYKFSFQLNLTSFDLNQYFIVQFSSDYIV